MKKYAFCCICFLCLSLMQQNCWAQDLLSISGLLDTRYNYKKSGGEKVPFGDTYRNGLSYNLELYPQIRLNDGWTITAIICHSKNVTGKDEDPFDMYRIAANGKINDVDVTVGSFKYWPMNGLINGDARLDGIKMIFGHKVRTTAVFAKDMGWRHRDQRYLGIHFDASLNPKVNVRGGFFMQQHELMTKRVGAVGADIHLDDNLMLTTDYTFSNYSTGDKSYIIGVNYHGGKHPVAQKGQTGAWLHYIQANPNATFNADTDIPDMDGWNNNNGNKGVSTGLAYMLANDIKWSVKYFNFNDSITGKNSQVYRTQVELFF